MIEGGGVLENKTKRPAMNELSACTILYASEGAQSVSWNHVTFMKCLLPVQIICAILWFPVILSPEM